MAHVLRTGQIVRDQEVVIERPDGSRVTVLVNIAPLFDKSGVQIGAVNCFQDLSVQKQSEQERIELQAEVRQSQKLAAIGHLVGGVAHDFNNLLTPIIGSLDMLTRRGSHDARELRLIDGALQSAERAKTLVHRLLAFARRQPLQSCASDIGALIAGMHELIVSTLGPQIELRRAIDAGLPPVTVDPNQIEMALLNLCINARDAMPGGGTLTIAANLETVADGHPAGLSPGQYIRVAITDTGQGMDAATMARAIEPFFSTKGIGKGTGLGLSMVDGLLSQLGGALCLSSEAGRGTSADLLLPVSVDVVAAASDAHADLPHGRAIGRILLVDDEHIVPNSTADMLSDLGYEVVEAASGAAALDLLERNPGIVAVVTDHLMPGMTGVELAHAVARRHPGVVLLTVSGFAGIEGLADDLALLAKPFRQADLADRLATLLRDRQRGIDAEPRFATLTD